MKTSELIAKLQKLEASIPFDADIVTGDDWMPAHLKRVYHEPPDTYLEFEEVSDQDELVTEQISPTDEELVRMHISHLLLRFQNRQDSEAETIKKLWDLVVLFKENSKQVALVQMNKK